MDSSITITPVVPAGTSLDYRGGTLPHGFLAEDGSAVSRTTYARLFAEIGTLYGVGDGSTTFNLPDSRGKTNIGAGQGSGLTNRTLGQSGGEETHTLTESEMPSHTHVQNSHNHGSDGHSHMIPTIATTGSSVQGYGRGPGGSLENVPSSLNRVSSQSDPNQAVTATNQNTGGGAAHNNMQPYLVAKKMIKY